MAESAAMKAGQLAFVAIPVLALAELAAHLYFAKRPPNEAQWREAAPRIAAMRKADDLVVVAPQWAEPMARMVLGDGVMPLRDVARPDESRYAKALEVSILGKRSPMLDGWRQVDEQKVGKFTVRRLDNPRYEQVIYDFVDHLNPQDARTLVHDADDRPCNWSDAAPVVAGGLGGHPTFPQRRFVCPGPQHVFAGVTVIEDQYYLPRRCIWMHPPPHGHIEAKFADVPLGKEIHGHSGLRWVIERDGAGVPIVVEVFVDGEKIGQDVHADAEGWKLWRMPLGARANTRGEVTVRVSAAHDANRQLCWEADTR